MSMSTRVDPDLCGRVLVHAGHADLQLAVETACHHPRSGLVFVGKPDDNARAAFRAFGGKVILDAGRWRHTAASTEDLFGLTQVDDGQLSLIDPPTLADVIRQAPASVAMVLTPTGFIPADRLDLMARTLNAAADCRDPRVVALLPTEARILEPSLRPAVCRLLASARVPVGLILVASGQPMAIAGRVAGLRALLGGVPDTMVLACEPAVALDVTLRGACVSSVGVTGGLRRPSPPGNDLRFASGFVSGMFLRDLWEHRSPPTYAEWYEGHREPRCTSCPEHRSFASYDSGAEDKAAILRHNLHTWLAVLDELDPGDLLAARAFLAHERRRGLDRHAQLRPQATLREFDPVIRQLVMLDDGGLPSSLADRPRS
jgi:hypothetical protein